MLLEVVIYTLSRFASSSSPACELASWNTFFGHWASDGEFPKGPMSHDLQSKHGCCAITGYSTRLV